MATLAMAVLLGACATPAPPDGSRASPGDGATAVASTTAAPSPRNTSPPPAPASMPEGVSYTGGDGSSVQAAVIVNGTTTDRATTRAEYAWLRNRYPGFRRREQTLLRAKGRYYDAISFDTADGVATTIYFDSTATFGKR